MLRISFENPLLSLILFLLGLAFLFTNSRILEKLRGSIFFRYPLISVIAKEKKQRLRKRILMKVCMLILASIALASPTATVRRRVVKEIRGEVEYSYRIANPAVVIAIDVSGSMSDAIPGGVKIDAAKKAIQTFLSELPMDVEVGLIAFSGELVAQVPITDDRKELEEVVLQLRPEGGTMYSTPLMTAISWLRAYRYFNISCALIFITDGLPADMQEYRNILSEYYEAEIPIFTVYIGPTGDEGELETKYIAEKTGGEQHTAQTLEKLVRSLDELANKVEEVVGKVEVRTQVEEYVEAKMPLSKYPLLLLAFISAFLWWNSQREEGTFF
ncbi:MAG TPA: VWA domain-containing protein [Candidatus Korarchaeota archaeon]|nr:VWA domain-containing protein [Candidatus Korarchaeota archaeon]